jgi:hypothetical protein
MNKKILYSDRIHSFKEYIELLRNGNSREILDVENRRKTIIDSLKQQFDVDAVGELSPSIVNIIHEKINDLEPYAGLVTHFPYDKEFLDELLNSEKARDMKPDEIRQKMYQHSFDLSKRIRNLDSNLVMIAYTGCSTGESGDPSTSFMNQMLRDAGFNDVVYKTRHLFNDSHLVLEKAMRLMNVSEEYLKV